jgi:hypothetical protein
VPRLATVLLLSALVWNGSTVMADQSNKPTPKPAPAAASLGTLRVGNREFHEVRVRSIDERSLVFSHREGIGSLRLRELPPEVQALLGYDPATAPPEPPAPPPPTPAPARLARPQPSFLPTSPDPVAPNTTSQLEALFLAYDDTPKLHPVRSLQPEFIQLGLSVKNQGRRPSCAIYAVVGALEFQSARLTGQIERFSEEYLLWATRRSLGLAGPGAALLRDPRTDELVEDAGFTLPSVISALQTYGIPLHDEMPNVPGLAVNAVPEPDADLIARARSRRLVFIASLPGYDARQIIPRVVHALNAGLPVPIGLRWPHERSITAGVLSAQKPLGDGAHAVTLIGYESPRGRLEDTWFIFKNSYGPLWGQGGYGRVSYAYLSQHLLDAYVLDLRQPVPKP